tara:strand:- start:1240 stop:2166 length:927 start_codon:yes stop_codon:yes gene_type:complete
MKYLINKINLFLKQRNYVVIFRYGNAIGDHLCITGIISKIYEKKLKIIICSNYPELFENNPKIFKIFNLNNFFYKKILLKVLNFLEGENIKSYRNKINQTKEYHFMKFYPKNMHFGFASAFHFNMNINFDNFKNEIFFTKEEIVKYEKKFKLPSQFSVIHSEAKKTYMKNKDWGPEKIQKVVDEFDKIEWVQVGQPGEYILKKTSRCYFDLTLRELAFIISRSSFLVSMEGMFNHMASAFNKKNFLIHIGVLPIESTYYPNNILIEKNSKLKCYPCFSFNCLEHKKHCEENLTSDYAISIIKKNFYNK